MSTASTRLEVPTGDPASVSACGVPLPRRREDGLPPAARRAVIGVIVAIHAVAGYGLLQIGAVREAVREAAPIFAGLFAPATPAASPAPAAPEPPPVVRRAVPPPAITAAPTSAVTADDFVVPAAPAEATMAHDAPPSPPQSAPARVAAEPAAPPRTLSVSDVGYLEPPRVSYPPVSRRQGEEGRVLLRVLVDPQGQPAQVLLAESSGFARLDDAAASATRRSRFRPYTENGTAQTVWVMVPIVFTLEVRP
jgi:protein TonB